MQQKTVIRLPAVLKKTNLSRSTIYRLEAEGKFCTRLRLGENSVGYYESEVDDWIANRPRVTSKLKLGGTE